MKHDNSRRTKPTTATMIIDDLGYCCLQKFFQLYGNAELIGARLGVTGRAVRKLRAQVVNGHGQCDENPRCLKLKEK